MGKKGSSGKIRSVKFPIWMYDAIEKIAGERKSTFTDILLEMIRLELEPMGYTMGIGREVSEKKVGLKSKTA